MSQNLIFKQITTIAYTSINESILVMDDLQTYSDNPEISQQYGISALSGMAQVTSACDRLKFLKDRIDTRLY